MTEGEKAALVILLVLAGISGWLSAMTWLEMKETARLRDELIEVIEDMNDAQRSREKEAAASSFEPDSLNFYTEVKAYFGGKFEVENSLGDKVSITYPSTLPSDTSFDGVRVRSPGWLRHGYRVTITMVGGKVIQFTTTDPGSLPTFGSTTDLLLACNAALGPYMLIWSSDQTVLPIGNWKGEICS